MLLPAYIAIAAILALCLAVYVYRSGNDDLHEVAVAILLAAAFWPVSMAVALLILILDSAVVCLMTSAKWVSRKIDKLQDMAKKNPDNNG